MSRVGDSLIPNQKRSKHMDFDRSLRPLFGSAPKKSWKMTARPKRWVAIKNRVKVTKKPKFSLGTLRSNDQKWPKSRVFGKNLVKKLILNFSRWGDFNSDFDRSRRPTSDQNATFRRKKGKGIWNSAFNQKRTQKYVLEKKLAKNWTPKKLSKNDDFIVFEQISKSYIRPKKRSSKKSKNQEIWYHMNVFPKKYPPPKENTVIYGGPGTPRSSTAKTTFSFYVPPPL